MSLGDTNSDRLTAETLKSDARVVAAAMQAAILVSKNEWYRTFLLPVVLVSVAALSCYFSYTAAEQAQATHTELIETKKGMIEFRRARGKAKEVVELPAPKE